MCRNRVQYRSAKPERQAFGLRPARPPARSPRLRCARPVGLRYRRAGALVVARLSARRAWLLAFTPACGRLQRPAAPASGHPPPRPAAGSPPARARGTLLRRASVALRAPSGAAPLADPPPGCAGRGPRRPPLAPSALAPAGCGTGCPAPLRAGGDGGFAPHARPGRWGGPRGLGASHGHPATGRCAPSRLRASRPVALARRASGRGSPRPPAHGRRGGAAPPASRPPRVRGYAPDTPQGRGFAPAPYPTPCWPYAA